MAKIDRFAAFRPAAEPVEDLFAGLAETVPTDLPPPVPAPRGHENSQKCAMSPQSPWSPELEKRWRGKFPLTEYMVALMKHSDIQQADPVREAKWYGLTEEICRAYLAAEKQRRAAHR